MQGEIPRGSLSTIILSTLLDGDKYGYEIIDKIAEITNNVVSIKQPSLYSSLRRMEQQKLISSYWRDSEIGGKRHYYRLTDLGRKQTIEWSKNIDLESIVNSSEKSETQNINKNNETTTTPSGIIQNNVDDNKVSKPTFLEQESLFSNTATDVVSTNNNEDNQAFDKSKYVQFDLFSSKDIITSPDEKELTTQKEPVTKQENVENEVVIEKKTAIEEPVVDFYELQKERNILASQKSFVESSKNKKYVADKTYKSASLLAKEFVEDDNNDDNDLYRKNDSFNEDKLDLNDDIPHEEQKDNNQSEIHMPDDAIFITEKVEEENLPKVRKIQPSPLEAFNSEAIVSIFSKNNQNLSYKNILNSSEKSNEASVTSTNTTTPRFHNNNQNVNDLDMLKRYFSDKNIDFKVYEKQYTNATNPSTPKDYSIPYILCDSAYLLLSIIASIVLCFTLKNAVFSFPALFVICPIISAIPLIINLVKYFVGIPSKETLSYQKFTFYLMVSFIIIIMLYSLNMIVGIGENPFVNYTDSFTLPSIIVLLYPFTTLFKTIYYNKNK